MNSKTLARQLHRTLKLGSAACSVSANSYRYIAILGIIQVAELIHS